MAVIDDTQYTLSGEQVKDLVQKVKAGGGGGLPVISPADNNYSYNSQEGVDIRKFDTGVYIVKQGTRLFYRSTTSMSALNGDELLIIHHFTGYGKLFYFSANSEYAPGSTTPAGFWVGQMDKPTDSGPSNNWLLQAVMVQDVLTSTSTKLPLSANQGKKLNDRLTTLEGRFVDITTSGMPKNPDPNTFYYTTED